MYPSKKTALLAVISLLVSGLTIWTPVSQPANAATTLELETPNNNRVVLGALASRSQRNVIVKSGSAAPYTYTGTDSTTGESYQYKSDQNYSGVRLRESDERPGTNSSPNMSTYTTATNQTFQGKTGVLRMVNSGNIASTPTGGSSRNTKDGIVTYGSAFGPQVYSKPFWGTAAQAVDFSWWASGSGDEYEIYAYLVKLTGIAEAQCTAAAQSSNFGTNADHTILAYGRGKTSTAWTLASNSLPETSCYRVRFVHGTYDASGGLAVGATFYVADFQLGLAQVLDFTQPSDYIKSATAQTFTASITSNAAGATISLASTTTAKCTVSGLTVTVIANATGTCTLRADSAAVGSYGSAASVFRSFTIRSSATAPVNNGGNLVTGTRTVCNTLTAQLGEWGDGGAAITSTTYQWLRNGSNITGATGSTYAPVSADSGQQISFRVTRTNSVGATSGTSNAVVVQDLRLSAIALSDGVVSPTFDSCSYSYTSSTTNDTLTITGTLAAAGQTLQISGSSVISGRPSQELALSQGANTISIVVSNGSLTQTTTLVVTLVEGPEVFILAPSTLSATTATIRGLATANTSDNLVANFVWSTNPDLSGSTSAVASPGTATGNSETQFSADLSGLSGGVTYYYALIIGETQSVTYSFTTPNAPIVFSSPASDISKTAATLSASVNDNTVTTTVYFQIATSSGAVSSSPLQTLNFTGSLVSGVETSASAEVSGLRPGTKYYFRAVGTNAVGTNYGSILSFTTLADAPEVTASAAIDITATTATLPGSILANGANTSQIVLKYSTAADLSGATSVTPTPSAAFGVIERQLEYRISGLTQGVTYYYRYEATNSVGTGVSAIVSFVTVPAPEVTITGPSAVSSSDTVTLTIAFSEAVDGLSSSDIVFNGDTGGWTLGDVTGSGSSFTLTLTPDPLVVVAGNLEIGVSAGVAESTTGTLGRLNLASAFSAIRVDIGISAPNISYSSATYSFQVGQAISIGTPTSSGGNWASIAISPSLTAGATFNSTTGLIAGTGTAELGVTTYTVTATNPAGSSTFIFTLEIEPAPAPNNQPPRVPSFDGPSPTLFIPRVIEVSTSITVKIEGSRLAQVTRISHQGQTLRFRVISNSLIELDVPPTLSVGVKEIRFEYSPGGIVSYLNALEITPKIQVDETTSKSEEIVTTPPESPEIERPFQTLFMTGFVAGTTRLTKQAWAQYRSIRSLLRSSASEINCVGYTMGPTVMARDIRLSFNRANYVCSLLKKALPKLQILKLEGRQDLRVGPDVRRVEIEWRG